MGYISEVRLVVSPKGYKEYLNFFELELVENPLVEKETTKDYVVLGTDRVKWYKELPEIEAVYRALRWLNNCDYSYSFARFGEDIVDNETFSYHSTSDNDLPEIYIDRVFMIE